MKGHYKFAFFAVLVGAALLNLLISLTNNGTEEYKATEYGVIKASLIKSAAEILDGYDTSEYGQALDNLRTEAVSLTEYIEAKKRLTRGAESLPYLQRYTRGEAEEIAGRYTFSVNEAQDRLDMLGCCIGRLEYALGYEDYLARMRENAKRISSVSIFGKRASQKAARLMGDFYGLENLPVSARPEEGMTEAVRGGVCDVLALLTAAVCGALYAAGIKAAAESGDFSENVRFSRCGAGFMAAFIIGICVICGGNILAAGLSSEGGLGDLSRPVQSVSIFRSCCYPVSAGAFLGLGVIFRAAVCLAVYLVFIGIEGQEGRRRKLSAAAAVPVLAALSGMILSQSDISFPYRIIGIYRQPEIFGAAADPLQLLFLGAAFGTAVSMIFAARTLRFARDRALRQAETDHYNRISERWNEARQIRHDIGNHMAAVSALLDKGDIEGAKKYLGEARNSLLGTPLPARTGSAVLDMLIAAKTEEMKRNGVTLLSDFRADFSSGDISDFDLCVIFGNILDNAFEAVSKLPVRDREIRLAVKRQMDMVMVFCENKYNGERPSAKGFATSKADRLLHGSGIRGIRRTAEKYGGHFDIEDEGGVFKAAVILKG